MIPKWFQIDLADLQNLLRDFKNAGRATFAQNQRCNIGTSKWRSLDRLIAQIRQYHGIQYLNSALFQKTHKRFKWTVTYHSKCLEASCPMLLDDHR